MNQGEPHKHAGETEGYIQASHIPQFVFKEGPSDLDHAMRRKGLVWKEGQIVQTYLDQSMRVEKPRFRPSCLGNGLV